VASVSTNFLTRFILQKLCKVLLPSIDTIVIYKYDDDDDDDDDDDEDDDDVHLYSAGIHSTNAHCTLKKKEKGGVWVENN
jgi:hypothetical protein